MKHTLKKDKYKSARGGYSRLLSIGCRSCGAEMLLYQKDGPGNLRRLYMDRIFLPQKWTDLQNKKIEDIPPLRCFKCDELLGVPFIYQKEHRKAFRLFQDSVTKKIKKIN